MSNVSGKSRLREIDGWRAISVMLVILHHLAGWRFKDTISRFPAAESIATYSGPLGVEIFFVISGFVICRMLLNEEDETGWISLKGFYVRRFFRILPPLGLYLGVSAALIALGMIRDRWIALGWASLFLFDLRRIPLSWFFGHTWSLAVEEQFYLIFPALWLIVQRKHRSKVFIAAFILCVCWGVQAVTTSHFVIVARTVPPGFAGICCGVLMAIQLLLMFSVERGDAMRAVLNSKMVQATGVTSYGIYLWQQLFTGASDWYQAMGTRIPDLWPLLFLIVASSYMWIEKPAMRLGRRISTEIKLTGREAPRDQRTGFNGLIKSF